MLSHEIMMHKLMKKQILIFTTINTHNAQSCHEKKKFITNIPRSI